MRYQHPEIRVFYAACRTVHDPKASLDYGLLELSPVEEVDRMI